MLQSIPSFFSLAMCIFKVGHTRGSEVAEEKVLSRQPWANENENALAVTRECSAEAVAAATGTHSDLRSRSTEFARRASLHFLSFFPHPSAFVSLPLSFTRSTHLLLLAFRRKGICPLFGHAKHYE